MNEIFDKLILRIIFSFFICFIILCYKYIHQLIYPASAGLNLKKLNPVENPAESIYFFGRLLGIAMIFTELNLTSSNHLALNLFHFALWGVSTIVIYIISLYITENVLLTQFNYLDEIIKRKNLSYAVICFVNSIAVAKIIHRITAESEFSLIIFTIFWLLALVSYSAATKLYSFVSKFELKRCIINKNIGTSFSFAGLLLAITSIIDISFKQVHHNLQQYSIHTILSMVLSLIIFPIFFHGLHFIFKSNNQAAASGNGAIIDGENTLNRINLGQGFLEGCLIFGAGLLTSVIIGQIEFGIIYPFF
jgi:uncharacterized membrane protein YjfL (UPF0719 family)